MAPQSFFDVARPIRLERIIFASVERRLDPFGHGRTSFVLYHIHLPFCKLFDIIKHETVW